MKYTSLIFVAFLIFTSTPVLGAVNVEVECNGPVATVQISILNNYGSDFSGLILTRQAIGLCEDPVVVTSSPIPLPSESTSPPPATEDWVFHEIPIAVPYPNVNFKFTALLVDESGIHYPVPQDYTFYPPSVPSDVSSNGDAPIMRGSLMGLPCGLEGSFNIFVTPCEEGCWGEPEMSFIAECVNQDDILFLHCYQGIVDILGLPFEPNGMVTPFYIYSITDIVAAPDGACSPVPVEEISFGALKAQYR